MLQRAMFRYCTFLATRQQFQMKLRQPELKSYSHLNYNQLLKIFNHPLSNLSLNDNISLLYELKIKAEKPLFIQNWFNQISYQIDNNQELYPQLGSLLFLLKTFKKEKNLLFQIEEMIKYQQLYINKRELLHLIEYPQVFTFIQNNMIQEKYDFEEIKQVIQHNNLESLFQFLESHILKFDEDQQVQLALAMVRRGYCPESLFSTFKLQLNQSFLEILVSMPDSDIDTINQFKDEIFNWNQLNLNMIGIVIQFQDKFIKENIFKEKIQNWIQMIELNTPGSFQDLQMIIQSQIQNESLDWKKLDVLAFHLSKNQDVSQTLKFCKFLEHENIISNFKYLLGNFFENFNYENQNVSFEDQCYTYCILYENLDFFQDQITNEIQFHSQMNYVKQQIKYVFNDQRRTTKMGKPINSDIDYHYDYNSNLDRLLNLVDLSEFFEVDGY